MATLYGTDRRDTLSGGADDDTLRGLRGDDWLYGKGGDDALIGGEGNDHLFGDKGDDELFGHEGRDRVCGGLGNDGLSGQEGADTLRGGKGIDSLGGAEGPDGERFRDHFFGGDGDDTIFVGIRDVVDGGDGFDHFYLTLPDPEADGARADFTGLLEDGARVHGTTLRELERGVVFATDFADRIVMGSGGVVIEAGTGDDRLVSGGYNTLYAREGDDTLVVTAPGGRLYGGEGADTFAVTSIGAFFNQFIFDLDASDVIDLHRIDADVNTPGNQAFTLVDAPSGAAGELYLTFGGYYTTVAINVDATDPNDDYIAIVGDHTGFTNFIL
ncbi:MAG TPA: hypothetical protein VF559_04850 [Caulobacteraceae bacterium]|jgi:Ca2+-binding RTX toxin-like protein